VRVVAVLSLKGGVGKTTVVLGLAGAAMRRGLPTLVVDLDPQGNSTVALRAESTERTVAEVLDEPRSCAVEDAIGVSAWSDTVHVLTGSENTERHNHPEPDETRLRRLASALDELADPADGGEGNEPYPLVLIDCPPSLGQLSRCALVAADQALLVTDPTIFAVAGVQRAFEAVQHERNRHNPRLQPLGLVVNRVRARSAEHAYRVDELRELFGPLVLTGYIPDRSAIQQAQGACVPIQRWDTPGAREVATVFGALLGQVLHDRGRPVGATTDAAAASGDTRATG
jgi:cellulose biosynthesis protein BcsQ